MSIIEKALEKTESFKPAEIHENLSDHNHTGPDGMMSDQDSCDLEIDFRILEEKVKIVRTSSS